MGLYRQIAGDQVGLFLEAANIEMTNGGGGGEVFYDPGFPIPIATATTFPMLTPSQPLQPDEPGGTTSTPPPDTSQPVQTATADSGVPATTATPIPGAAKKKNYMPLLTLGALFFTMVKGEQALKKYKGIAFLGGLGALFYELSQTDKQDTPTPIT